MRNRAIDSVRLNSRHDSRRADEALVAYFGELSTTEISGELSLPLGTVKGRMRLGLEKLRREIDQN